jgi:ATP-binding protein involved in chromosome partitioning
MPSSLTEAEVLSALNDFPDPETGRGVVQLEQVRDVRVEQVRDERGGGAKLRLTLALTTHSAPLWNETRADCIERLRQKFPAISEVQVDLAVHSRPPAKLGEIGLSAKSVIAVGSGKGGVGKSTIAASLAFALKRAGCVVGIMDADVYGPSIPHLLGLSGQPEMGADRKIVAKELDGLKVMSMGFLVPKEKAVIWRGPMLHGAITQMLRDTGWGDLDYLIIDMPPGTGDIALTLSQLLPLTGAVVVCTPQEVALLDAVKAIGMFRQVNIPLLGMVENMSTFACPGCNKRYDIFGSGGARLKAQELDVPFLGEVPIRMNVRVNGDAGNIAANFSDADSAGDFEAICHRLVKNLAKAHAEQPVLPSLSVL